MPKQPKLPNWQRFSEENPNVIFCWRVGGKKPNPNEPHWSVDIDSPDYSFYTRYMNTFGNQDLSIHDLEDWVAEQK